MELILVSGTQASISTHYHTDLHFRLDLSPELPRPFFANPWKRSKISPLRDRLMIEWVFSSRDSMRKLHSIITSINNELSQKSAMPTPDQTTQSKTLIVGISYNNGTCLSPCFVEKLYDHFSLYPPFDGFTVKRTHLQANQPSSDINQLLWQQLPCSSKYSRRQKEFDNTQQIKVLITSRDWSPVPADLNAQLEQSFSQNSLNTNAVLGDVVVDFVSGYMYNKSTGQRSFLRCSINPSQATVFVRHLTHESYKPFWKSYVAAGILPYSIHPVSGEAIFLVGKLTYDGGTWCDFGGLRSRKRFKETPSKTAARECYEESLGVLGSSNYLLEALHNYVENNAFKIVNEDSQYVGHFLRIPFDHYPARFATLVIEQCANGKPVEVDAIRWIPLSSVKTANQSTLSGNRISEVYAINEMDGSVDISSSLQLRTEFAHSLCMAEKLGIFDSIAHIALHQSSHSSSSSSFNQFCKNPVKKLVKMVHSGSGEKRKQTFDPPLEEDQHLVDTMTGLSLNETTDRTSEEKEQLECQFLPRQDNTGQSHDTCLDVIPSTDIPDRTNSPLLVETIQASEVTLSPVEHEELPCSKQKDKPKKVVPHYTRGILLYGMGAGQFIKSAYFFDV